MSERFRKFYGFQAHTSTMNNPPHHAHQFTLPVNDRTTSPSTMFSQGYVEWYWVALGLVVPIFLGVIFCVLDHFRRRQAKSTRNTEQRIESMCERNKYVPPSYEDVIPNNIVIDSLPDLTVASTDRINLVSSSNNQSHTLVPAASNPDLHSQTSRDTDTTSIGSVESTINTTNSKSTVLTYVTIEQQAPDNTDSVTEVTEAVEEGAFLEAPPSYDDYDKYEVFGSQAYLV